MSQIGTVYDSDAGSAITIRCPVPSTVDGTDVTSARVFARLGSATQVELDATISEQTATRVTLQHVTTGALAAGTYSLRAWLFVGSTIVATSKAARLIVTASTLTPPTAP
jgi:hypothetical protein